MKPIRTAILSAALALVGACDKVNVGRAPPPPAVRPPPPAQPAGLGLPFPIPGLGGATGTSTPTAGNTGGFPIPGLGNLPIPIPGLGGTNPVGNGQSAARPEPPAALPALPPGAVDPSGSFTPQFIRDEARAVFAELVGALPAGFQARISGIPLVVIEDQTEVNAMAGCSRSTRRAFMGITAGLLTIESASAETRAADEVDRGGRYEAYVSNVAGVVRGQRPVPGLAPGAIAPLVAFNARKLSRQRHLFDEQVAFVLGHELAHHYRGHTGCQNGTPGAEETTPDEITRTLAHIVPLFNQPLEMEADQFGVVNTLDAGRARVAGAWTEEGADLGMDFFGRLSTLGVETLLLGFLRSHPPPAFRLPIIDNTAREWRQGRRPAESGTAGLPIPIPGLTGLRLPFPGTH